MNKLQLGKINTKWCEKKFLKPPRGSSILGDCDDETMTFTLSLFETQYPLFCKSFSSETQNWLVKFLQAPLLRFWNVDAAATKAGGKVLFGKNYERSRSKSGSDNDNTIEVEE